MRVRAVAAPSPESNAIGPVELECTNQGLHISYLGVGAFREGFATAALTTGTHVVVPWPSVTEFRLQRDHVFVGIEPRLTPHNKLALVHFSDGLEGSQLERTRRRRWVRLIALVAGLCVGALVAIQLPKWVAGMGGIAAIAWGLVVALVTLLVYASAERLWLPKPRPSEDVQREFINLVKLFRPVAVGTATGASDLPKPVDWNELIAQLPRSTLAIAITLTATGIAFILTAARFSSTPTAVSNSQLPLDTPRQMAAPLANANLEPSTIRNERPPSDGEQGNTPPPTLPAGQGSNLSLPSESPDGTVSTADTCQCKRADSVLWSDGFPRLSTLLISSATRQHNEHLHLELELGVVNNSNESIPEVNLMVQFFEDEGRRAMKERPLHYEGPLRPGKAVKWHVEARGTSFVVHNPIREVLGASGAYAPAAEFAELLKANHRPVRLHGSMMLAFLGDQRAKGGAVKLQEALRESEQPYLERVLQTQGDMISCDWRASAEGRVRQVRACAFNQSNNPQNHLAVRVRGLDRPIDHRNPVAVPPQVLVEQTWDLPGEVAPHTGRMVEFSIDVTNPEGRLPIGFEFLVDRADRLPQ